MAAKLIEGFAHVPGVHCGSTALADVTRHKGIALSEAMCFGLGAGLAFYLLPSEIPPTRMFLGRTASMEEDFCRLTGLTFREETEPDDALAWERVREKVDANEPVILSTDLRYLPYYRTQTPFNGHRVVLAGYDDEKKTALLADTDRAELQEVALSDLHKARTSDGPPAGFNYSPWWEIGGSTLRPLEEVIPEALKLCASRALEDVTGFGGCDAIARMAEEIPRWGELEDLRTVARFGYGVIEKRGTGGALFRRLYARFLDEAAQKVPALKLGEVAAQMHAVADAWSRFAETLKPLGEGTGSLDAAAQAAHRVALDERRVFESLRGRF